MPAELHLAVDAFALQVLLEGTERLIDIVIANDDLHGGGTSGGQDEVGEAVIYGEIESMPTRKSGADPGLRSSRLSPATASSHHGVGSSARGICRHTQPC